MPQPEDKAASDENGRVGTRARCRIGPHTRHIVATAAQRTRGSKLKIFVSTATAAGHDEGKDAM